MSNSQASHRGRIQAQGDDLNRKQKGGYSRSWAQNQPITDQEGLSFLDEIKAQCNQSEQKERKMAFKKAKQFIMNASKQGGVGPESQPPSFKDRNPKPTNARVDIEIKKGSAFIPYQKKEKVQ
jgi:hypothetical protein